MSFLLYAYYINIFIIKGAKALTNREYVMRRCWQHRQFRTASTIEFSYYIQMSLRVNFSHKLGSLEGSNSGCVLDQRCGSLRILFTNIQA